MEEATADAPVDAAATCRAIAADLEELGRDYPQLRRFRADKQLREGGCPIDYEHNCHPPERTGGWTAGVPNPDPDGIWFYIDLWDPNDPAAASSQINTQPVTPPWMIGERRVTFLVLEGDAVTPASAAILEVLERHGMRTQPTP
ncbi:MAG: hypothetical protein KC486_28445 [Myxococcales bacterium]|nr:hypothetical protein [Myxococcales bacterium]